MDNLIFQLQGPLASWGDTAVGEYRPTSDYPSQSAILGLLAAAFGIERADETAQFALRASYRMAIGVLSAGRLLRDYHTAQVPSRADLKKRPHATRRDELALPKYEMNTILSTRDYRQEAAALVVLQATSDATYSLARIAAALREPQFHLYMGRKSCPLAAPLHPQLIEAANVSEAMGRYLRELATRWAALPGQKIEPTLAVRKIVWGDEFAEDEAVAIGQPRHLSTVRKDQMLARVGWQFGDRREHIALLEEE